MQVIPAAIGHALSPGANFLLWGIPLLLVVFAIVVHLASGGPRKS